MWRFVVVPILLSSVSFAVAAVPTIETVSAGIGQRGTTFELKIVGAGLEDVAELLFYRVGIDCQELRVVSANELIVRLNATEDCHLGSQPFRLRSLRGLSELRTFWVTPLPVVASIEPNDTFATAQPINMNTTIAGVAGADDIDCYRVLLKAGQFLNVEAVGVRLGGPLIDTKLQVYDPDGKLISQSDDTPLFRQDPLISLVAARDGEYIVQVSESTRDGDDNSRYALNIGSFPRPQIVYPAGGEGGQNVEVRFWGDARGEFRQSLKLSDEMNGELELYATNQGETAPTPLCFRSVPFPNVLENEPDNRQTATEPVRLPRAFNGVIQQPGDTDEFAFTASAGETWRFDLFSDRIGSALDAVMTISAREGQMLAQCDDWESHDCRLDFTVPRSAEYILTVTDKRGAGGPFYVYRVEATTIAPSLTAFMPRPNRLNQDFQTICVPRGNRVMAGLGVQRQGIDGNAFLTVQKAPDGVSVIGGEIQADRFWTPVIFQASENAPLTGCLSGINAVVQSDGKTISGSFRQAIDLVNGPADALYYGENVDRVAIAVVNDAPVKVNVVPPSAPLPQDGTLSLKVTIERQPGFTDPVDVIFPLLPPWVDGPASLSFAPNQAEAAYQLRSWPAASPRTWKICAEARPGRVEEQAAIAPEPNRRRRRTRSSVAEFRVASELIDLSVASSPVSAEPVSIAGERGGLVPLVFRLQASEAIPDGLTATLEGLPNRVSAEPVNVETRTGEINFSVRLEPDAPLGEFRNLNCRLSRQIQDQAVSYVVGRKSSLTVTRPGELVRGTDGKPMGRLEALRRLQQQQPSVSSTSPTSKGP